jgi:histidinol-phosphate aminotransferase
MSAVPKPRQAVLDMAAYVPPTGGRLGKLRLDFNENTTGCSPRVIEFLRAHLDPERLAVYPDYGDARRTLAHHFNVSPNELLLTNGTDEAIQVFLNTYVDDGDRVVLLRPSYAMYRFYAQLTGATISQVDYVPPKLAFPMDALIEAIDSKTRAVIVSNPNNPTGVGIGLADIERILQRSRSAGVLIDEAYFEFSGVTALPLLSKYPNLFVSRTFSKIYGMAAMRIGVILSQAENIAYLHKAQSPYSVNTLAAMAAAEAAQDKQFIADTVAETLAARQLLCAGLERLGIEYVPSVANFVLIYVGDRAREVCTGLLECAILVRDRSHEIPGAVRITAGTCSQTKRMLNELERIW